MSLGHERKAVELSFHPAPEKEAIDAPGGNEEKKGGVVSLTSIPNPRPTSAGADDNSACIKNQ